MTAETEGPHNWFASGASDYARYRPTYPDALPALLARMAPDTVAAADIGCGNGQFTCQLARHFQSVTGVDPSADQIAHASSHARVRYVEAPAEALPLPDASVSLVTAAQAAHWFDLPRFYAEAGRIGRPDAILALVSYGIPTFDPGVDARFQHFYREEIRAYWPPERRMVETGYADMAFPFAELPWPAMAIRRAWDLAGFLGYVSTWSATRMLEAEGRTALLDDFARDLTGLWGDPAKKRPVRWPIAMRIGRL